MGTRKMFDSLANSLECTREISRFNVFSGSLWMSIGPVGVQIEMGVCLQQKVRPFGKHIETLDKFNHKLNLEEINVPPLRTGWNKIPNISGDNEQVQPSGVYL